jgi:hypothetical protein
MPMNVEESQAEMAHDADLGGHPDRQRSGTAVRDDGEGAE